MFIRIIRGNKKLYKLYTNPTFNPASRWFPVSCEMYSLCSKLYTNYTLTIHWSVQNPTQNGTQTLHKTERKPYTYGNTNPTRTATQTLHCNVAQFYLGAHLSEIWGRQRKTRGRQRKTRGRQRKTRGRQRKTRGRLRKTRGRLRKTRGRQRKIWGRQRKIWGRQIKIWGRQIKIWGRQILTGCAPNFS